jgi:hypothetical protein
LVEEAQNRLLNNWRSLFVDWGSWIAGCAFGCHLVSPLSCCVIAVALLGIQVYGPSSED